MNRARVRAVNLPAVGTALFLIDVINDLHFEASAGLVAQAEPMALRLAVLKRRATAAGVPCLYANDNFGQWRSDFPTHRGTTARHARLQDVACHAACGRRREILSSSSPSIRDFFDTTLDTLLVALRIVASPCSGRSSIAPCAFWRIHEGRSPDPVEASSQTVMQYLHMPRVLDLPSRSTAIPLVRTWITNSPAWRSRAGCVFALDSDAHTTGQLVHAETAIAHARLAGISPDRIVNCWPLDRLLAWIAEPMREAVDANLSTSGSLQPR